MGMELKKRTGEPVNLDAVFSSAGCSMFKHLPNLSQMLTAARFDDGSARMTSTMTIFCDGGALKVCLHDRANGVSAWASGASLEDALGALEIGLEQDTLLWRRSGGQAAKKGRK